MTDELTDENWWREGVIYEVYPRSFADSDRDGVGDLRGILEHLDYLNDGTERSLGVDAIWLPPIYSSPMVDFGYDVTDHCDVHPLFGDLAEFDRLVEGCHARGIRVILDLVLNHTSDQHRWFRESRSSRQSARRDWYHWRDPAPGGGPPTLWTGVFGGSAWAFDAPTGQYYLHSFLPQQPDLNFDHPAVVAAMINVARFWMARGVDGFRLDAVPQLVKPTEADPDTQSLSHDGHIDPRVVDYLRVVRRVLDERPGRVGIAEAYGTPAQVAMLYGGEALDAVQLVFHFEFVRLPGKRGWVPWDAAAFAALLQETQDAQPAVALPCYALSNHDVPRFLSRQDTDGRGPDRARAAALFLLGVRGTPCLYYGDEIGMPDVAITPDTQRDPAGRDAARTPMLWDRSPGRGFTSGTPWLPFGPLTVDVASQLDDKHSLLSLYRRAIWFRKREPALRRGDLKIMCDDDGVLALRREASDAGAVLVALNTALEPRRLPLNAEFGRILLATDEAVHIGSLAGAAELVLPGLAAAWVVA